MFLRNIFGLAALAVTFAGPALAADLIMVERVGCHYCAEWKRVIGPIYPKSPEGQFAPLRLVDLADGLPQDIEFARRVTFTPTFVLVDENKEVARIEGYPGEDFFWGLLNEMLVQKVGFEGASR